MLLCRQSRVSPSLPLGHPRFVWSHMSEADRVFSRMTTPGSLPTPALPAAEEPAATPAPTPPVGHLMPGWEPLLPPLEPAEPAAKIRAGVHPRPRVAKPERANIQSKSTQRAFADPFAADDSGAN